MAIFYNILLDKEDLNLIDDLLLLEINFSKTKKFYTEVICDVKTIYNSSILLIVSKFSDVDTYKKELLQIIFKLIKNDCSFLITFNGEDAIYLNNQKHYFLDRKHFKRFDLVLLKNDKAEIELSKIIFNRVR